MGGRQQIKLFIWGLVLSLLAGCSYTNVPLLDPQTIKREKVHGLVTTVECGPNASAAWNNTMLDLWGTIFGKTSSVNEQRFFVHNATLLGINTSVVAGGITPPVLPNKKTTTPVCFFAGTSKASIEAHAEALGFRIRASAVRLFATPATNSVSLWRKFLWSKILVGNLSGTHDLIVSLGGKDQNAGFLEISRQTLSQMGRTLTVSFASHTPDRLKKKIQPIFERLGLSVVSPGTPSMFILDGLIRKIQGGQQASLVFRDVAENQNLVVWGGGVRHTKDLREIFAKLIRGVLARNILSNTDTDT